jgi:hypothetical protein
MDQAEQQSAGQVPEQKDVSRQTMVVLVILAIVVSLLGTLTVFRETAGAPKQVDVALKPGTPSNVGEVRLEIVDSLPAPAKPMDSATGRVVMEIVVND